MERLRNMFTFQDSILTHLAPETEVDVLNIQIQIYEIRIPK
jgi:hypothetical protein